jgi:hypothetical protein
MLEGAERPENGRSLRVVSILVLAADFVLMAMPPVLGILVLSGVLG